MPGTSLFTAREQRLVLELVDALGSSLDLKQVLAQTHTVLSRLIPLDHGALCISKPGRPGEFDWAVAELPDEWFGGYAEMAPHDFVRRAVLQRPNLVLRDEDMISRRELEANFMYHRSRELGMPLEHVMSVHMAGDASWNGGVTLYRGRRRPFSDRDRSILQHLTPLFTGTVRNCRRFSDVTGRVSMLEALLRRLGSEAIIFAIPAAEVARTARAGALLQKWFSSTECGPAGVPSQLLERLTRAAISAPHGEAPLEPWIRSGARADLRVSFLPCREGDKTLWALVLEEVAHSAPVPEGWAKRLTPREIEVVSKLLLGWDNRLIAEDVGCTEATVKKHLQHVFDKLGVDSRARLTELARRTS